MSDEEPRPRRSKKAKAAQAAEAAPPAHDEEQPAEAVPDAPRPRRSKKAKAEQAAAAPPEQGYRSTRRSSKIVKRSRRGEVAARVRDSAGKLGKSVGRGLLVVVGGVAAIVILALMVVLAVNGINGIARWSAERRAQELARQAAANKSHENLLVIGVQDGQSTGFLAMRVDKKAGRVFGIAIPDGAFVEVPGQGFERLGDSFKAGPDVSMAAVTNYLSVPFDFYVTVDDAVYKNMLKTQDVSVLVPAVLTTNLSASDKADLASTLHAVSIKNVGLAPLPVRSISIGGVTYYEPQRDQIADLLLSWWGVRLGSGKQAVRVILYNGAGKPGVAGVAARALIKSGFRVVDTGNADRFNYATTQVILYNGDPADAIRVRDILGVGQVTHRTSSQDIADVVVIIGRDYASAH